MLIESTATGGQAGQSSRIENYLGFPDGVSGDQLATGHAGRRRNSAPNSSPLARRPPWKSTDPSAPSGSTTVVPSTGARSSLPPVSPTTSGGRWLRRPVRARCLLRGGGVDRAECEGEEVYVIGGANSAGQAAMYLSGRAKSVTIFVRGPSLEASMSHYLIQQIESSAQHRRPHLYRGALRDRG